MSNKKTGTKNKEQGFLSFEDQLSASAKRMREAQDACLVVAEHSRAVMEHSRASQVQSAGISQPSIEQPRRLYWGWIATPAAAVIGLLIGLFVHKPTEPSQDFVVPVVAAETAGQSILDDGTDYALFVRM